VDLAVTNAKIADATIQNAKIGSLDIGKLTTGSLTADVTLSGLIKAGDESGARVTIGPDGVVLYATDGSPSIVLPTDPDQTSMFKGDVEADGLTVTGGIALRPPDSNGVGGKHEISKGASLTLQQNITAPQSAPTVIVDYEMTPTQAGSWGTGLYAGDYGLVLNGSEWNTVGDYTTPEIRRYSVTKGEYLGSIPITALSSYRPWGGVTRIGTDWFFLVVLNGTYTIRKLDSSFALVTSATYTTFAGENGSGGVLSKALAPASIGTDGTNVLIGEWDQANKRFRIQTRSPSTLAVTSTMNTSAQNGFNGPVVGVIRGTFDFGVERTMVTTTTGAIWAFDSSGNYQVLDSFLAASVGLRGLAWNPTPAPGNFQTLSATNIHKYSTIRMTGQSSPQTWYCVTTWNDHNPAGTGTHQTTMSPVTTFQMKRRARMSISTTKLPGVGGVDDPDSWLIYLSNTTKDRLSFTGQINAIGGGWVITLMFANFPGVGNPPEVNQFLASGTASRIRSVDDSLVISGDGSIVASSISKGPIGNTDPVAIEGPYMYTHQNADTASWTNNGWASVTTWTTDAFSGITRSGGTFTVPKAGRYRITAMLSFNVHATGVRGAAIVINGTSRASMLFPANSSFQGAAFVSLSYVLPANGTILIQGFQNSGVTSTVLRGDANGNYTNCQIEWVGP
jgi:hypothetical protein